MARGGVFCIEGQWHRDLNERGSVLPTLELLERLGKIRFIHKDAATRDELFYFVDRWLLKQYADHRVGFFAMHGEPSRLCLTDWESVALADVAELMAGRCEGRRLYFGSCSVLRASDAVLRGFLDATGAALICGYTARWTGSNRPPSKPSCSTCWPTASATTPPSCGWARRTGRRSPRTSASG